MTWKNYFSTSIGKKLQMGFSGLFLILFLIVHCYVNAQIFWNDGGEKFDEAAHFMGTNFIIRTIEIGLVFFLLLHIIQGLLLWAQNKSRRSSRYAVSAGNATSHWYSRSMGLLGTLLLIFLVIHASKFWIPNRASQTMGNGELPLYDMMREEFQNLGVVIIYLAGCISLAWHLVHGFYSSFQTLGLTTNKYKSMIKGLGIAFSIIVPLIFALMPIAFYLGWIS
ncbi:MAG: succinate dehydrogenase (or fumarate reductase) cytochrome b subunit, b558 family [Flavipsychrobacter sp.]|jgi:succinate dehydrogenase / fumarate reductase cytochrome b subunit|nr:succinate dehydrogenase (or fumarate reductase) cytochrome b subunit, b558 family [Flavipsychrobacter sp.]